ncbi:pentatricopeptide repeat-containing protein At2g13600-like [Selaginella moellendorffii]|uniref:pentatricopeptide repeat-containing protein At2g13600-like n=1 Tax=Selaginella moellendorffii TaxID=88036 RepID=UPI000D1D06E0|nr:pentatricopeptide repeat-containing protein At2g13600-like [Selaginella moellendorffii]|eukprot:XP_024541848.1 pentatricopeptide repeat-containing protein At2g13600-like [Selaginella moellendorffii]
MRVARTNVAKLLLDLRMCSSSRDLERGKRIHEAAGRIAGSIVAANALVAMYARCGSLDLARGVFDRMPCHNAGSWSSLVLGYVENGEGGLGVEIILSGMIAAPDSGIFLAGFKACAGLATKEMGCEIDGTLVKTQALEKAMALHSQFQGSSCGRDYILHNNMVSMYSKCGSLADARRVFDRMLLRDVVSWNSLVMGCAENEEEELALELFGCMGMGENCEPDSRTLVAVLKACAMLAAKEDGCHVDGKFVKLRCVEKVIALHDRAREMGCDREIYVASTLVDAYAKCGRMADSQQVFDSLTSHNVVSWTALIRGYVENGQGELALELFHRMKREGRTLPDALTLAAALKACATMAAREEGKQIDGRTVKVKWLEKGMVVHSQATRMVSNSVQVANTVIDMYCRCGSMLNARKVFDTLRFPTVVSWNALLLGYADNGEAELLKKARE